MKLIPAILCAAISTQAAEIIGQPHGQGIITLPKQIPGIPNQLAKPSAPLLVIRDAKAYAKFLDRIPAKQISRTRPAPPNEDPLLDRPKIDFKKHTLLVLTRPFVLFGCPLVASDWSSVTSSPSHPLTFTGIRFPHSSLQK